MKPLFIQKVDRGFTILALVREPTVVFDADAESKQANAWGVGRLRDWVPIGDGNGGRRRNRRGIRSFG